MVRCCHVIGPTLLGTTFCAHCFSFYAFTAFNGSEGTNPSRGVSPRSTIEHHGLRSKELRRTIKQDIDYAKHHHTPHCWLLANVMYPVSSTTRLSWLTRSTPILIVVERLYIYCANGICKDDVTCRLFTEQMLKYWTWIIIKYHKERTH